MKAIYLNHGYIALVDDEDYERVNALHWSICIKKSRNLTRYYAKRSRKLDGRRGNLFMHNLVMGARGIDHADGHGLNNQKYNLRPATHAQNQQNARRQVGKGASPYRGVFKTPTGWRVRLRANGTRIEGGTCKEEVDAATVYNFLAEQYHGEFATLNTPLP